MLTEHAAKVSGSAVKDDIRPYPLTHTGVLEETAGFFFFSEQPSTAVTTADICRVNETTENFSLFPCPRLSP